MKKHIFALLALIGLTAGYSAILNANQSEIILRSSIGVYHNLQLITYVIGAAILIPVFFICKRVYKLNQQKMLAQREFKALQVAIGDDPVKQLVHNIEKYLNANESTEFFREKLEIIRAVLPKITGQIDKVERVIDDKFTAGTISYNNFMAPIENMQKNLISLGNDLLTKLDMFCENSYSKKIAKLEYSNPQSSELSEYKEILVHYTQYANDIVTVYESTQRRLDKLVLEISKLDDNALERYLEKLKVLDDTISNTKLYK